MKKLNRLEMINGYFYILIDRNDTVAIYGQYPNVFKYKKGDITEKNDEIICKLMMTGPVGYEVFHIQKQNESDAVIGGVDVHFEAKEKFPTDEEFGRLGWSISDETRAMELFLSMKKGTV